VGWFVPNFLTEQRPTIHVHHRFTSYLNGLYHVAIGKISSTDPDAHLKGPHEVAFFRPNKGETTTIIGNDLWNELDLDNKKDNYVFKIYIRDILASFDKTFSIEIKKKNCIKAAAGMPGNYLNIASDTLQKCFDFPNPAQKPSFYLSKNKANQHYNCVDLIGGSTTLTSVP
jgi:hypothetical protein